MFARNPDASARTETRKVPLAAPASSSSSKHPLRRLMMQSPQWCSDCAHGMLPSQIAKKKIWCQWQSQIRYYSIPYSVCCTRIYCVILLWSVKLIYSYTTANKYRNAQVIFSPRSLLTGAQQLIDPWEQLFDLSLIYQMRILMDEEVLHDTVVVFKCVRFITIFAK